LLLTRDTDSPNLVSPGPSLSPQRLGPPNFSTFRAIKPLFYLPTGEPCLVIPDILGPKLSSLVATPGVTDVLVNGHEQVWVQRGGGPLESFQSPFDSAAELGRLAQDLIASGGRHLDQANPFADVSIGEVIRVHAALASTCHPKTLLSVRIHLNRHFGLDELAAAGMFGELELQIFRGILAKRENFLIAGAAGAGKTTLLRAMLAECRGERVIAVEDVAEIGLQAGHFISLQTRQANNEGAGAISLERLVREALRMRPDRLAVGEIRGAELLAMVQALNTGHSGGGATIHANSFETVSDRVGAIGWQCGLRADEVLSQVRTAIDWLIYVGVDNGVRRVMKIGRFS
jgi:pilus assembly protein CpaF